MVKELTVQLEKKYSSFGGGGGSEFDDLDKIASELDTDKKSLLNSDIIKDIHVKQIKIRHSNEIDSIQFLYKVTANNNVYHIQADKQGGDGGKETIIDFENDERILSISGRYGRLVEQLNFSTYIPSKEQIKTYGPYGFCDAILPITLVMRSRLINDGNVNGGNPFDLPALACAFGRRGCSLDAFGIYRGKVSSNYERDKKQLEHQNQELSYLLFPNQPYNFNQFKQEITRLKYQELAPQVRVEKAKLDQLITDVKTREGSFAPIIDLFLATQKQITEQINNTFAQGQLTAYQTILQTKLTQKELQDLLNQQNEFLKLEKHLVSLQQNQQQ